MSSNVIDCHIYSLFIGNKEDHMLKISLQQLYSWYTHQNVPTVIPITPIGIITVILITVKLMVMIPDMILRDHLAS